MGFLLLDTIQKVESGETRAFLFYIYYTLSSDKRYKITALLDSRCKTLFQLIESHYFNMYKFFKKEKIILCSNSKLLNIENSPNPG
ncbi:hypothetical protein GIHI108528_06725 [Gillisia hiemivivida]